MNIVTLSYLIHQCANRKLTEAENRQLQNWLQGRAVLPAKNASELTKATRQDNSCFH